MDAKSELIANLSALIPEKKEQIKEIVQGFIITKEGNNNGNLCKRIEHFLTAKRIDGLSMKTLKEYKCKLNMFAQKVSKQVSKISTDDIRDYIGYLTRDRELKESSVQTHINTLRSFFGWLDIEELIKRNPMRKIKSSKIDRNSTRNPLSAEELEQLRNGCKTPKEKAMVEFMVSSGCRLTEIIGIRLEQINWQDRSVKVKGKGNKERTVYFSVRAKLMLQAYIEARRGGAALFTSHRTPYGPMGARAIQKLIQKIGERAQESRRIHPHLMRHTFATDALNRGMDITVIQRLLGHTDPKTTLIYAELSSRTIQYEYERVIA